MNKIDKVEKGGMMKKFLVLICAFAFFIACDYATESISTDPDVEITYINPMGWYVYSNDTLPSDSAIIEQVSFVAENSVDCYLSKLLWEYYDTGDNSFFGPHEISLYMKIEGKSDTACVCTAYVYNIMLPIASVARNIEPGHSAEARLSFVFVDEYYGGVRTDTAVAWYGFYVWPDSTDAPAVFKPIKH